MLFFGADPDLDTTSIAAVDESCKVRYVAVAKSGAQAKDREAVVPAVKALYEWVLDPYLRVVRTGQQVGGIAVEAQEIYRGVGDASTKNPRSLLLVGNVAGAALVCLMAAMGEDSPTHFPAPQAWKGSVPKPIHQARILHRVGWQYEQVGVTPGKKVVRGYAFPANPEDYAGVPGASKLKKTDWKHVTDAIGLALYARDQYNAQVLRTTLRTSRQGTTDGAPISRSR